MSEVDDESLYSFGSGQPDDARAADSTSYSTEWAPLPASGGASPRARSPRSDGASATAALSFSTAAVSADAALGDADEVESIAAPVDDEPPPVEEEEEEEEEARGRKKTSSTACGAGRRPSRRAALAPTPRPPTGRRRAGGAAVDEEPDEPPAAEEEDILDRLRREQAPLQARSPADDAGDALLTVADLGDWSGAADNAAPADTARRRRGLALRRRHRGVGLLLGGLPAGAGPRRNVALRRRPRGDAGTEPREPRERLLRRLRARRRHAGAAHGRGPRRLVGRRRRRRRRAGAHAAVVPVP